MLTLIDFLFIVMFAILFPLWGAWRMPRLTRAIERGRGDVRLREYIVTIIAQWTIVAALLALWVWQDRTAPSLGFSAPGGVGFWTTSAIVAIGAALFVLQVMKIRTDEKTRQQVLKQIEPVKSILPHSRKELCGFMALSTTAGICEEILYRGYGFWLVLAFGAPTWAAVLITAVMFGFGHLYQGPKNAVRIVALGVVFGVMYWWSGSIWTVMAAHIVIDVMSGLTSYIALRDDATPPKTALAA